MLLPRPTYLPAGTRELPSSAETRTPCEWPGISDSSRLTVSEPPVSPRSCSDNPGPWPGCMGARPCRSGSAKFDLPLPPYVVPSSENSAVFCESGSSCPSHQAQPLGAKLNGKIRISATKGSAMISLLGQDYDESKTPACVPQHHVGLGKIPKSEIMKSTQR